MQLEYIISSGYTALTDFNGSVVGIKTIQIKVGNGESISCQVVFIYFYLFIFCVTQFCQVFCNLQEKV